MGLTIVDIALATDSSAANAQKFAEHLNRAMHRFQIDSTLRRAAFLATVSVESAKLTTTEESLYYKDAARLASIYPRAFKNAAQAMPYTRNSKALGDLLYQGYWGRGLIQLTWKANYQKAADALGYDYVRSPALVAEPEHAAATAAWFWASNGCNEMADRENIVGITRAVNGPALMHLAERQALYRTAKATLT